ncbi:MAG: transposase [Cyanobacteria bacterium J06635_10]
MLAINISRTANDWFIAFAYEVETSPFSHQIDVVGVDLGVKTLATLSTGVAFPNPKHYFKQLRKLQRLSRQLARKQKGSNNRHFAKIKLAKLHLQITNITKDTLHKITTYLCKNHARIVVEDLNVSATFYGGMKALIYLSAFVFIGSFFPQKSAIFSFVQVIAD